jgi:hypothetical protein
VAFDQSQLLDEFLAMPDENNAGTTSENRVVIFRSNFRKKCNNLNCLRVDMVRSEGLEPPRFYSLPPQGSASTNSATSAKADRH